MKIRSSRLPGKSGSLCQFTQVKTAKDASEREYPAIEVERDVSNINHFYWCYTYKDKNTKGKFVTRTKTVPRCKVPTVKDLIAQNTSVEGILEYLRSSGNFF
jgi:Sec7-like guanine-nucleotide exchange factor